MDLQTKIKVQNEIQQEAVNAWVDKKYVGTIGLGVGGGKTFIMFKAAYHLLEQGLLTHGAKIWIRAEVSSRWQNTIVPEAGLFKNIYNKDFLEDFDVHFHTYQSKNICDGVFEIYDEVHDLMTAGRIKLLTDSAAQFKLGLTGTPNEHTYVFPQKAIPNLYNNTPKFNDQSTKGDLYALYLPIVYERFETQLIEDGILSPFITLKIPHKLNNSDFTLHLHKDNKQKFTERGLYEKIVELGMSTSSTFLKKQYLMIKLPRMLYTLPSKVKATKKLLETLEGPTILFGVTKSLLRKITPNVIDTHNKVSLVEKFNNGEIDVIATAKALQQGVTLKGLRNVVIVTFQKSSGAAIQGIGRVLRYEEGKLGKVFFIVTEGTLEEKWYKKLQEVKNRKNEVTRKLNLNEKRYFR